MLVMNRQHDARVAVGVENPVGEASYQDLANAASAYDANRGALRRDGVNTLNRELDRL